MIRKNGFQISLDREFNMVFRIEIATFIQPVELETVTGSSIKRNLL